MNDNEYKIPLENVLEDMYNKYSPTQFQSRKYYYEYYATDEERVEMDLENLISTIVNITITIAIIGGILFILK